MALQSPRFKADARLQRASENNPAMRSGETGEPVRLVQQALIDLGFPMPVSTKKYGSPDGIYGAETAAKVKEFQAKNRLSPDGVAGKQTLAKMDAMLPGPAKPLPPLPKAGQYTHKVRLHLRSISVPDVPEFTMLSAAEKVYGQYGIKVEMASGQSLLLDPAVAVTLDSIDGECLWDQASDEQKLLFGQGTRQGVGPNDILVYYVNHLIESDGSTLNGCAGHEPDKPAVVIAATGTRWTLSHELGHVLLGPKFDPVHVTDVSNVMHAPTTEITANPPRFTDAQIAQIRKSKYCQAI